MKDLDFLVYWNSLRLPVDSVKKTATKDSLKVFYYKYLKSLGVKPFCVKFDIKSDEFSECITFTDGCYSDNRRSEVLWTLPWFGYNLSVGPSASHRNKNINSIVENSIIMMRINGVRPSQYFERNHYDNSICGFEPVKIIYFTQILLASCCFFYSTHYLQTNNRISIERFLYLCAKNLYESISINDTEEIPKILFTRVIERNTINFRSKYGKGKNSPVKVTVGNLSRGDKHAISMYKYAPDYITNEIWQLYPDYSVRKISELLEEKGIKVSKSKVHRHIQIIRSIEQQYEEYESRLAEI